MRNLFLLSAIVLLSACAQKEADTTTMPPAPMSGEETAVDADDDDMVLPPEDLLVETDGAALSNENGLAVTLDSLMERDVIQSPLLIGGTVRRDWLFEGSFPITLMTLEGEVVQEWYGTGAWLEPLEGDTFETMSGDDMIGFVAAIDFEAPEEGDMGKIRFGNSVIAEEDVEQYVDLMILWP